MCIVMIGLFIAIHKAPIASREGCSAAARAALGAIPDLVDDDSSRDERSRSASPFELTAQVFDQPVPMPEPEPHAEGGPMGRGLESPERASSRHGGLDERRPGAGSCRTAARSPRKPALGGSPKNGSKSLDPP